MKPRTTMLIGVASAVCGSVVLLGCSDGLNHESYADRAAAAPAIQRGWLPAALPHDAADIQLAYYPDNTDIAGSWRGAPLSDPTCAARDLIRPTHEAARKVIKNVPLTEVRYCPTAQLWTATGPDQRRFLWQNSD